MGLSQSFKLSDKSVNENQVCTIDSVYFDLTKHEINEAVIQALKPTLDFLRTNESLVVEIGLHRDSRGSNKYSTCHTCRRANSIKNYLIENGINELRLVAKGYGESNPITIFETDSISNDTIRIVLTEKYIAQFKKTNPIKFNELHQLNRRLELKILRTNFVVPSLNTSEVKLLGQINGDFTAFTIDNFDNIYTTSNDVIVKYNSEFDTLFYSSLKSVLPSSIESSKSFRNLVFDKERGSVIFLDNTLTEIYSEFDLIDLDIMQPVLVCESFNGNAFWVLDETGMQLVKLNQNLEVVTRIDNLGYLFENKETPIQMFEKNDELYIHFPNDGIAIFDSFGTFLKYLPHKSTWIDVQANFLLVLNANQISILELPFLDKITRVDFKLTNVKSFRSQKRKFYVHTNTGLYIYALIQNTDNK